MTVPDVANFFLLCFGIISEEYEGNDKESKAGVWNEMEEKREMRKCN